MKSNALVAYYSLSGNTEFVAEKIAEESGADLLEISPVKEVPKNPVGKYLVGGFKALFKAEPQLKDFDLVLKEYSLIYLGTPVWAGRMAPPVRSWLTELELKNKSVKLFSTCRADSGGVLEEMEDYLPAGNKIVGSLELVTPLQNKSKAEAAVKDWIGAE